jgi:uncharacterized protein (DUF111 family)
VLTALAPPAKVSAVTEVLLRDTSTLGVRVQEVQRVILPRRVDAVQIPGGTVHMKVADLGDGHFKAAPEYQDCKRLADQTGRPIREIMEDAAFAYRQAQGKSKKAKAKSKRRH